MITPGQAARNGAACVRPEPVGDPPFAPFGLDEIAADGAREPDRTWSRNGSALRRRARLVLRQWLQRLAAASFRFLLLHRPRPLSRLTPVRSSIGPCVGAAIAGHCADVEAQRWSRTVVDRAACGSKSFSLLCSARSRTDGTATTRRSEARDRANADAPQQVCRRRADPTFRACRAPPGVARRAAAARCARFLRHRPRG